MTIEANIIVTNANGIYIGVFDNSGTWEQASMLNLPTHIAVLDEKPTGAGTYTGTVYEPGETIDSDSSELSVDFIPKTTGQEEGTISGLISDVSVVGIGENRFDVEHLDNENLNDNIMQLYRK